MYNLFIYSSNVYRKYKFSGVGPFSGTINLSYIIIFVSNDCDFLGLSKTVNTYSSSWCSINAHMH